jgi:non-homologous end joining protein Ku
MATAVWTGTLSFGLVTLPVRLFPATQPKDVRFHLYDREGRRIRYQRVVEAGAEPASDRNELPPSDAAADEDTTPAREERSGTTASVEKPVAWDEVVRGVETDEGELVTVPREELDGSVPNGADPSTSRISSSSSRSIPSTSTRATTRSR